MAATGRNPDVDLEALREGLRDIVEFRAAITRMWPILTPAELLHDLFGSSALLRLACEDVLITDERDALHRPRSSSLGEVVWSESDVALLDEALAGLGPRPRKSGRINEADEVRSYGHIVIDEVQDLTPMQLRMVSRRSLNGSMTVVGDLAQATGPFAPDDWSDVLRHLPDKRQPQVVGLSVGYRIPSQIMELADKVMKEAAPSLRAPTSVRDGEHPPQIIRSTSLLDDVAAAAAQMVADVATGNVAVVCPDQMADAVSASLTKAGLSHGRAGATALDTSLTVVPVSVVKGLELDGVIVVEPAEIVAANQHGLRLLYVALTRSTQRLTVVHAADLPASMR
jgi:DNA helicase IV